MNIDKLPRIELAHLPTPIEAMETLSAELGGAHLFVKRDDCTGLATGGNKTRKLEYLLADAKEKGADTLITEGGSQSNHCRQTAAAAAKVGLDCTLVLNRGFADEETGNLLLDRMLGAEVVFVDDSTQRGSAVAETAERLQREGRTSYVVPTGGSNGLGAMGYAIALREIQSQEKALGVKFDAVVVASGSGGTQGGLVFGKKLFDFPAEIIGISDGEPRDELSKQVLRVAREAARLLNEPMTFAPTEVTVFDEYYGEGYGIPNEAMVSAVKRVARTEGILLDPVYSGKAMAGLIDLVGKGHFNSAQNVLFIHTGGTPALFAYAASFR